jgi:hypothetical protein
VVVNLAGEIGDQLGSLGQIGPPNGIGTKRWWNARQPGQRADRRQLWETPVKDGGDVACRVEVATAGGCQQMADWVLTGLRRQVEEVCPQGWPGRFGGESGEVLVDLVELCDGLWPEELFCCDVEAVGVALNRLE